MTDPADIARGLTEAQRNAVAYNFSGYFEPGTIRALRRKGLLNGGKLTELGLTVRKHLESRG